METIATIVGVSVCRLNYSSQGSARSPYRSTPERKRLSQCLGVTAVETSCRSRTCAGEIGAEAHHTLQEILEHTGQAGRTSRSTHARLFSGTGWVGRCLFLGTDFVKDAHGVAIHGAKWVAAVARISEPS